MYLANVFGFIPRVLTTRIHWESWSMFKLSDKENGSRFEDIGMLCLATAPKIQDGDAFEECMMIRDEVGNMVWGVERVVPLATGLGKSGFEAAAETLAYHRRLVEKQTTETNGTSPTIEYKAAIRYQVMNSVPENWIPFIPVHISGNNREVQLQRTAMPRIIENDPEPAKKVRPKTVLLREGLDQSNHIGYFIHEEEVTRAGVVVSSSYRRTRWRNGEVVLWL